ncbi:hypothetical protein FZEAL_5790 [Fusarium zealandicum]|uniref:Isochorismatase family protein family n=1 Tax=Fusarium zealandicum TaxID=1053134 RepID=A0A8H4UJ19_9HYPO|nr:hypothetical protein FZEAL_5790 [Fusarium zealandicum]
MFPFDQASLPQITTRKAFIGVDFQHDFIAQDGALPIPEPEDLVDRTIKLATAFRDVGDVIWVQSQFDEPRPVAEEQIITTDKGPKIRPISRGRPKVPVEDIEEAGPPDPEAFLSHDEPGCVKADTTGCRIAAAIEEAWQKTDTKLTKSNYSAFQGTHLLRILRAKMAIELFICGSLANVGVYATALDAAGHGMSITIVEDCCGYRTESRKTAAIASLIELTGCEIASYEEVIEDIQPKPKPQPKPKTPKASRNKSPPSSSLKGLEPPRQVQSVVDEDVPRKSPTPEIVKNMSGLRLASDSPGPAAAATQTQSKASSTCAAESRDSEVKPPSKSEEPDGAPETTETLDPTDAAQDQDVAEAAIVKESSPDTVEAKDEPSTPEKTTKETKDEEQTSKPSPKVTQETGSEEQNNKSPPKVKGEMDNAKTQPEKENDHILQKGLCEGDTDIIENVLSDTLVDGVFDKLRDEIQWQRMSHQGGEVPRLVAVQGEVGQDGSIPVYRHPSDESPPLLPFSPTVMAIKAETEKHLGHPLNHVLIQYYRDGSDYISEHSDKTLDIVKGSYIANVSLGAERTMVFRTKRRDKDPSRAEPAPGDLKRKIQRAKLPHNSLCRLGLPSNMKWLHAIRQDKRPKNQKSEAELVYDGGRISLTFRQIGTFLNCEKTLIWGQGAKAKTREDAHPVINGQTPEAIDMLKAFGTENHATDFDWEAYYGKGFDVLHMSNAPRLFACADPLVNMRIALTLAEFGVNYAKGSITAGSDNGSCSNTESFAVKFVDKDKSTVQGDLAIMLYLDARYGLGKPGSTPRAPENLAAQLTRFQRGMSLLDTWRSLPKESGTEKRNLQSLKPELQVWHGFAAEAEGSFLAGPELSLPDFALWPILHTLVEESGLEALDGLDNLKAYYERVAARPSVTKVLGKESTSTPDPPEVLDDRK